MMPITGEFYKLIESQRYGQCLRKRKLPDKDEAEKLARTAAAKSGKPVAAYKCRFCDEWHIGHSLSEGWETR
jgi:hypothetical protein